MKKHMFLLILLMPTLFMRAQTAWEILSPSPTTSNIQTASFITDLEGWMVDADGNLRHTEDGGTSWNVISQGEVFTSLQFTDQNVAYAITATQAYKTNDGGLTWSPIALPGSDYFFAISFFNNDLGFISGEDEIYKTTNGGTTWSTIPIPAYTFWDFAFMDETTGFAAPDPGGYTLYKTADGGLSWSIAFIYTESVYQSVWFLNQDTGFACGYIDQLVLDDCAFIIKTTDGGNNWEEVYSDIACSSSSLHDIRFKNNTDGFAIGNNFHLYTTDGGDTWIKAKSTTDVSIPYFEILNKLEGKEDMFAVGNFGTLFKWPQDSVSWHDLTKRINGSILEMAFVTEDTGWVLTSDGLLEITDGQSWSLLAGTDALDMKVFDAVNEDILIGGKRKSGNQFLFRSINGGQNWDTIYTSPAMNAFKLQMVDEATGYILEESGSVWKTGDGGFSWQENVLNEGIYNDIQFLNENEGWVLEGDYFDNALYHTTDGGATWTVIFEWTSDTWYFKNFFFLDPLLGWVLVSGSEFEYYQTTDGGITWTGIDHFFGVDVNGIFFTDSLHGFLTAWEAQQSVVFETSDGGASWQQTFSANINTTLGEPEYAGSGAVYISDDGGFLIKGTSCTQVVTGFGYVAGGLDVTFYDFSANAIGWLWDFGDGTISNEQNPAHTYALPGSYDVCLISSGNCDSDTLCELITIIATSDESPVNAEGIELVTIFPNPFSESLTIQFSLSKSSKVAFDLFDLQGRKIETIAEENFNAGHHQLNFTSAELSEGVYFIRCKTSDKTFFVKTIKQ